MSVPPIVESSSGMSWKSGFRKTCGTRGLVKLLKPLISPTTSIRSWLARTTAPWMVALRAGVSPPAVRIPMRFTNRRYCAPPAAPASARMDFARAEFQPESMTEALGPRTRAPVGHALRACEGLRRIASRRFEVPAQDAQGGPFGLDLARG